MVKKRNAGKRNTAVTFLCNHAFVSSAIVIMMAVIATLGVLGYLSFSNLLGSSLICAGCVVTITSVMCYCYLFSLSCEHKVSYGKLLMMLITLIVPTVILTCYLTGTFQVEGGIADLSFVTFMISSILVVLIIAHTSCEYLRIED